MIGQIVLAAAATLWWIAPAHAVLVSQGLTYTLSESTVDSDTHSFTLSVTGINTASDTEGGRTGLNAVAFTQPDNFLSATMTDPAGFVFVNGGLASTGCNTTGNFFCFDNPAIPPTPTTLLGASFDLTFLVNTTGAFPADYDPSLKIDWVGTQNNYDLVSLPVGIGNGFPPPPPPPPPPDDEPPTNVPEPGSLALLGGALVGMGWIVRRRKTNLNAHSKKE